MQERGFCDFFETICNFFAIPRKFNVTQVANAGGVFTKAMTQIDQSSRLSFSRYSSRIRVQRSYLNTKNGYF